MPGPKRSAISDGVVLTGADRTVGVRRLARGAVEVDRALVGDPAPEVAVGQRALEVAVAVDEEDDAGLVGRDLLESAQDRVLGVHEVRRQVALDDHHRILPLRALRGWRLGKASAGSYGTDVAQVVAPDRGRPRRSRPKPRAAGLPLVHPARPQTQTRRTPLRQRPPRPLPPGRAHLLLPDRPPVPTTPPAEDPPGGASTYLRPSNPASYAVETSPHGYQYLRDHTGTLDVSRDRHRCRPPRPTGHARHPRHAGET